MCRTPGSRVWEGDPRPTAATRASAAPAAPQTAKILFIIMRGSASTHGDGYLLFGSYCCLIHGSRNTEICSATCFCGYPPRLTSIIRARGVGDCPMKGATAPA
jgi:hypothetical protein